MNNPLVPVFALTVLLTTFLAPSFIVAAGPVPLASHRAVYDLTLKDTKRDGGIENVRGRIVMEVENGCEGYVLNQRMLIELSNIDGGVITSDYHLSTWEDKLGDVMRFSVSNILNGRPIQIFDGVATKDEEKGIVTFKDNGEDNLDLPKDVIFPTAHTKIILQSARDGKNLVSAKVYDGNGKEGLQDSLTVIGKKSAASQDMAIRDGMENISYWPVQLAYFDLRGPANEPDYEISLKMYENGVATDLVLKYRDFSLDGKLVQLDFLKKDACVKN
ncbi:MAG: cell envelope integrity EipB family protein [Sneathiella sp.]|nr:cell envelope integrity EipB family protein [Sneathiella sp.]